MKAKQRLFIYDRREMGILVLLGVMVSVFAFTLGVHLGKTVGPNAVADKGAVDSNPVTTQQDQTPNRQELTEQGDNAQQAADDSLNQALHDEVVKAGVKLDQQRQLSLPEKTRSKNQGATTLKSLKKVADEVSRQPVGNTPLNFTLQIGSFPNQTEAQSELNSMTARGLKPILKKVEVRSLGKRYRLYLGEFETKEAAEKAGAQFRDQHLVKTFIVAKITE